MFIMSCFILNMTLLVIKFFDFRFIHTKRFLVYWFHVKVTSIYLVYNYIIINPVIKNIVHIKNTQFLLIHWCCLWHVLKNTTIFMITFLFVLYTHTHIYIYSWLVSWHIFIGLFNVQYNITILLIKIYDFIYCYFLQMLCFQ